MKWRLIDTDLADPYYVTAADDFIMKSCKDEGVIHFYRREPPGISVGRSRRIEEDINVQTCKDNNIKIVRRPSGGGTIFTDKGCLIYALTFRDHYESYDQLAMFRKVCTSIINALGKEGIKAEYKPPNDILINNRKISGSAQIKSKDRLLIHGTVMMYTDLNLMKKVLKNVRLEGITTIAREVDYVPSFSGIKKKIVNEFENAFNSDIVTSSFSSEEEKQIRDLVNKKYGKDKWNFMR